MAKRMPPNTTSQTPQMMTRTAKTPLKAVKRIAETEGLPLYLEESRRVSVSLGELQKDRQLVVRTVDEINRYRNQ